MDQIQDFTFEKKVENESSEKKHAGIESFRSSVSCRWSSL